MEGRKILKLTLAGLGVAVVIGYSCFVLYDFVRGPRIIIDSPLSGFSTTTPMISIIGRVVHTNNVTINDNQTAVDLTGNFNTRLILAPGYNIIKVTAKDSYGRVENKTIETVLTGDN
ncbi:MAG: hypothetical protein WC791_02605 [Candidatus Paceibacterota bacterium]|jgi:hypothetical protein